MVSGCGWCVGVWSISVLRLGGLGFLSNVIWASELQWMCWVNELIPSNCAMDCTFLSVCICLWSFG